MQGMPGMDEEESENLAALGMHISGDDKKKDEEDEDEEDEVKIKDDVLLGDEPPADADDEDEEKKEEEEVDALTELEMLAEKLKEEESPTMVDDMEE